MIRARLVGAALLATALVGAHAEQVYRWVDKDGRVHYTQQQPAPAETKNVERRKLSSSIIDSGGLPYATQLAVKDFPVTLYSSPDCGPACSEARESLQKRGIPFKEIIVGDQKTLQELKSLSGKAQVPTLRVGPDAVAGFEAGAWKTALDAAGYPASGLPQKPPESTPAAEPAVGQR